MKNCFLYWALLLIGFLVSTTSALVNVRQVLHRIHQKQLDAIKNIDHICPRPTGDNVGVRNKRQSGAAPLEAIGELAGLSLFNEQKILEKLSFEMQNAIFIGFKTATANANLGSREGPKVLPLGTTIEDLFKTYKIYRTTYTSYIEGWIHRVIHDLPSELKRNERNEIFRFSARNPEALPAQEDLVKYWAYDAMMEKDIEMFGRSVRDRTICIYEAFEDIFYQDVYKPNFVTEKPK